MRVFGQWGACEPVDGSGRGQIVRGVIDEEFLKPLPHSGFRHTTLVEFPVGHVGYTFVDEEPGFTGIYLRAADGGLWPARTVERSNRVHHEEVCKAWLEDKGVHEDKRSGCE